MSEKLGKTENKQEFWKLNGCDESRSYLFRSSVGLDSFLVLWVVAQQSQDSSFLKRHFSADVAGFFEGFVEI